MSRSFLSNALAAAAMGAVAVAATPAFADGGGCPVSHGDLQSELSAVTGSLANGGLGNDMWGTVVDDEGEVCAVARTGPLGDQWPGSRVISAQKANTAYSFSLEGNYPNLPTVGRALATGNLYGLVQPGGSLFGLQFSNPVDPKKAYKGDFEDYGTKDDPLEGKRVGGVNVFGGGLALYDAGGELVGAIGVSGDTACTDHIIAWRVRDALLLDYIPGGVGDGGMNDNLILNNPPKTNSFEHPSCGFGEDPIINNLATTNPIGP